MLAVLSYTFIQLNCSTPSCQTQQAEMQRGYQRPHISLEIYYHSNMCQSLWKTLRARSEPTLPRCTHLPPLMGSGEWRACFTDHEVFRLEVPEAWFSLSTPSPHLFRLLPLYSADDPTSSRLMESSARVRAHAHTLIQHIWTARRLYWTAVFVSSFTDWV